MPSKALHVVISIPLAGLALSAQAQLVVDERQLWDQRLFEVERLEEMDRPLQLRAYGGFEHDSNLFRLSSDADTQAILGDTQKSDNIYQVGAGAKVDLRKSRQRFTLDANAEQNWFQNYDGLNHLEHLIGGEWAWQAGNDWNGTLGAANRRFLNSFANVQQNVKDMIDRNRLYGTANYRPVSYLRFTVDADWVDSDHDAETRQALDNRTDSVAFLANWVTPSENTLGVSLRKTEARYPNATTVGGVPIGGDYDEQEYSLIGTWNATAASRFRGRFGHTERDLEREGTGDFSGPTWRFSYEWEPTAKTALEFAIWRELYGFEDLTGSYVRTTGIGFFPAWSVVPKLVLQARALYQTRDYLGDTTFFADGEREDKERLLQLAAIWTPLRLTKVIFMVETGDRDSNQVLADYKYNAFSMGIMRTF
jgi:exopolysaccharide biosynthesis operon protein EpsL